MRSRFRSPLKLAATARPLAVPEARRRWAELVRQIFEVDPLACPRCGGPMRILAFVRDRPDSRRSSLARSGAADAGGAESADSRRVALAAKIPTR